MRCVTDHYLRQMRDGGQRILVDRNDSERGGESGGRGDRQPIDRDTVGRAEQDDAAYDLAQRAERCVDAGRDRAGICLLYTSRCV